MYFLRYECIYLYVLDKGYSLVINGLDTLLMHVHYCTAHHTNHHCSHSVTSAAGQTCNKMYPNVTKCQRVNIYIHLKTS